MSAELSPRDLPSLSGIAQRDWDRGQACLERYAVSLSTALARAVSDRSLRFANPPCWKPGMGAMERVFGFNLRHHLFRADPLDWLQMTERQATGGLAWFLNAEDRSVRSGRIRAMLRALDRSGNDSGGNIRDAHATCEAPTSDGRRIDLLLTWGNASGGKRAAVIEAKFGHGRIKRGQLPAYRSHCKKIDKSGLERPMLFVVSPRRVKKVDRSLARNRDWRWISWRSLLLAFDRALALEHDDDAFRQFRRTLWDSAGS